MQRRVHDARELGQALADLRRHRGMTQEEVAEWLSVDRGTVIRLERGSQQALERLMTALSVLGADLVVADRSTQVRLTQTGAAPESG